MDDLVRRHAEIYFATLLALATLDVGEFSTATRLARRGLVKLLEELPETKRETQVHRLGIDLRTWYGWVAQVRAEDAEAVARGEELEPLPGNNDVRFFITVMTVMHAADGAYLTVGAITDRVNETLPASGALSYQMVQERLDMYVGLGQLELHPQRRNMYRSVLRRPCLEVGEVQALDNLLRTILPSVYRLTFQCLAGAAGSKVHMMGYRIPEGREKEFSSVVVQKMDEMAVSLGELEKDMLREDPSSPVSTMVVVYVMGRDVLAKEPSNSHQ